MLLINWTSEARQDLAEIVQYILPKNRTAAINLKNRILSEAEKLAHIPYGGRNGRIAGTREWVAHTNYIIIYRIGNEQVEILNIVHARMQYP